MMIYRYPDEYMYKVEYVSDIEEDEVRSISYTELDDEYVSDKMNQ